MAFILQKKKKKGGTQSFGGCKKQSCQICLDTTYQNRKLYQGHKI
jgi:hypothetical protein